MPRPESVDERERERLRRALYRPGAGEDDRARFVAVDRGPSAEESGAAPLDGSGRDGAAPSDAGAQAAVPGRRDRRSAAVLAAVVAVAIGIAVALTATGTAQRRTDPQPSVRQLAVRDVVFGGGTEDIARERSDLAALLTGSGGSLGEHLRAHDAELPAEVLDTRLSASAAGDRIRLRLAPLGRIDRGSRVTVLLACSGTAGYSWQLTASAGGKPLRAGATARCAGGVVHSEFVPPVAIAPELLTVTARAGTRLAVEVRVVSVPIGPVFGSASALH